ncbi:efflux RND transporter periplasmic adaptor subunit [Candidatus Woesebacteria bacterium]|nr:efflux RND transporter periplasmic adaptor subunit [Candidatus Woesebacteria bacterium]
MLKKLLIVITIIGLSVFGYIYLGSESKEVSYSTVEVKKGTLVSSISTSGNISTGNTTNISTKASGIVKSVYVKNGDLVKKGDKLITITLDSEGVERKTTAWSEYLLAKEKVTQSILEKKELEIEVWDKKQAILDAEEKLEDMKLHPNDYNDSEKSKTELSISSTKLAFDVIADKYSHSDNTIAASRINETAAYTDYLDVSGNIVAPADGIVNNLTLTAGSTLTASSTQSSTSGANFASSQNIGFVRSSSNEYLAKVNLTEVDAPRVVAGQKVVLTLDAHNDKSFTGRVLAVDISGNSSSGVSSYPATIVMDPTELSIYPNMSVSANIIISSVSDVLLAPSSSITTKDGVSSIELLVNGEAKSSQIEIGDNNGTQTVITSGVSEGDVVITSSASSEKNNNSSSAFSSSRQSTGRSGTGAVSMPIGGPGF